MTRETPISLSTYPDTPSTVTLQLDSSYEPCVHWVSTQMSTTGMIFALGRKRYVFLFFIPFRFVSFLGLTAYLFLLASPGYLDIYVSGSAYKIVNKRAYHHGTMLISTRLDALGDLLRTSKDTMLTKGVASVRSPVCNLQQFNSDVTHETFIDAVVREFREEYGVGDEAQLVTKDGFEGLDYIQRGMKELPSWEWAYGQTPEFTYTVSQSFDWGKANVDIKSKHGVILECCIRVSNSSAQDIPVQSMEEVEKLFLGKRYGFVLKEDLGCLTSSVPSPVLEIAHWVRNLTSS